MRLHMTGMAESKKDRSSNWQENNCINVWLDEKELRSLSVQAYKHGMSDARYIYRLMEYGMRDDSWLR